MRLRMHPLQEILVFMLHSKRQATFNSARAEGGTRLGGHPLECVLHYTLASDLS